MNIAKQILLWVCCIFQTQILLGQKPASASKKTINSNEKTTTSLKPKESSKPINRGVNLENFKMGIIPTFFVPLGSLALSSKPGFGLQYQLWYTLTPKLSVGFGTGIFVIQRKKTDSKAGHVIPYTLGVKFSPKSNCYFDFAAGMIRDQGEYSSSLFFQSGKPFLLHRFAYRAGVGFKLNKTWDLGLRYEGAQINSWAALLLTYKFVNKEVENGK